jgi:hypothetical protein
MSDLNKVLESIKDLRTQIDDMTESKDFTDPQAMYASRMLDGVLDEYQEIMKDKMKHENL